MNKTILSKREPGALLKDDQQDLKMRVVLDFPLEVAVSLGAATKTIGELMKLAEGAVIELDREIDVPADLIVNGQVVAKGKIVTIEENFGVRITSILDPVDRIEQLRQGGSD